MNKNQYTFYCKNCKTIPLIELNPKKEELNILTTCKCHKQYLKSDIFYKNYYHQVSILKDEGENVNKEVMNNLIDHYLKRKEIFDKKCKKLKEDIIKIFEDTIKKIESFYDKNNDINNKINKIVHILINNYKTNPNNSINIKNIIFNTQINKNSFLDVNDIRLTKIINKVNYFFGNNFIINSNTFKLLRLSNESYGKKIFLEIENNLFARNISNNYIKIFDNEKNTAKIKLHNTINNLLIDENKKHLISLENNLLIKFWDVQEIKNKLKDNNNDKGINIFPLYKYEHSQFINEILYIEKNILLLMDKTNISIYEYNIFEANFRVKKNLNVEECNNCKIIKRNNKINICCFSHKNFIVIDYPELTITNTIEICDTNSKFVYYEQINNDEIILGDKENLKIYDFKSNKILLNRKINFNITCLKILRDNTLLVCGRCEIKRFLLKTMQELPQLIILENYKDYSSDEENIGILSNLDRDMKDVKSIYEFIGGKIMIVMDYSIEIYGPDIDSDIKI